MSSQKPREKRQAVRACQSAILAGARDAIAPWQNKIRPDKARRGRNLVSLKTGRERTRDDDGHGRDEKAMNAAGIKGKREENRRGAQREHRGRDGHRSVISRRYDFQATTKGQRGQRREPNPGPFVSSNGLWGLLGKWPSFLLPALFSPNPHLHDK